MNYLSVSVVNDTTEINSGLVTGKSKAGGAFNFNNKSTKRQKRSNNKNIQALQDSVLRKPAGKKWRMNDDTLAEDYDTRQHMREIDDHRVSVYNEHKGEDITFRDGATDRDRSNINEGTI